MICVFLQQDNADVDRSPSHKMPRLATKVKEDS